MSLLKDLFESNLIKVFIITFLVLITALFLLIGFHLTQLLTPDIFSAYILVITNFIAIIASLIALFIPFVMKNIEHKKEEMSKEESMKNILKRLEEYINLPVQPDEEAKLPSLEMPFFLSLAKHKPNLLLKLGIEVQSRTHQNTGLIFSELYILDKYRLYINTEGLKLEKVDFYGRYNDIYTEIGISEKIIKEIKEKCNKDFGIKL